MNNQDKRSQPENIETRIRPFPRVKIGSCAVDILTFNEGLAYLINSIESKRQVKVGCLNAAKIAAAQKDEQLRQALDGCDLVLADGMSVVWAARMLGIPLYERSAGIDMMLALLKAAQQYGWRVFLLGARESILISTIEKLQKSLPGINIVGFQHGYYTASELPSILARINQSEAQMLFVALGTPQKELWIEANAQQLNSLLIMGVGGSFDVIAGLRKRAPRWMQSLGLEWFWRFVQEPRRMAKRYLVGNAVFAFVILNELIAQWGARYR